MPHFPHTPEALLGRNDSKNPASTCKGITSSGRACRRALALTGSRRKSNASALNGIVALVQEDGALQEADFYCWQHKDQAVRRVEAEQREDRTAGVGPSKRRSTEFFPLKERSSIDTLVQRLGIDAAAAGAKNQTRPTRNPRPPQRTDTADFAKPRPGNAQASYAEKYGFVPHAPRAKRPGFWESLCCLTASDDDYVEIVRHRQRVHQQTQRPPEMQTTRPTAPVPVHAPVQNTSLRAPHRQRDSSNKHTNHLLSLIPQSLPPQTTSALLAELVKPISPYDEDGYIYIFWLTPQSQTAPPEATARSLLAPPDSRPQYARRISDVMTEYSYDGSDSDQRGSNHAAGQQRTIMLKIGRANNITRRMHEWQRQCGYALNLVRWYPYVSSSTTPSPGPSPQSPRNQPLYPDLTRPPPRPATGRRESESGVHKGPHIHRVERLIHLELASKQVKRQCSACGKEHREWFEVPATQAGIKSVDEVVKRWVGWGERMGAGS